MKASIYIAQETLVLLRRHKVFVPVIVAFGVIAFASTLTGQLSLEDFRKVLFDFGSLGFHLAGGVMAIFWGAKSMTDSRQEGSLEVQLASPVTRSTWLVGKFLGLSCALLTLGVIFLGLWQGLMLAFDVGWMTTREIIAFGFLILIWNILAAVVVFFSSFCDLPVAVFSSTMFWVLGMAAPYLPTGLGADASVFASVISKALAKYGNLHTFNLSDLAYQADFPGLDDLAWRLTNGLAMTAFIIALACALFSRRDIIR